MQLPDRSINQRRQERFDRRVHNDYRRLAEILAENGEIIPPQPSLDVLWQLSCKHGIDLDLFLNGRWNANLFLEQTKYNSKALPERYSIPEQMRSRGRTVLTILDSIRVHLGENLSGNILRRLQIPASYEFTAEDYVSQNLIMDLLQEIQRTGLREDDFRHLGFRSAFVNLRSELGKSLLRLGEEKEIYRSIHEEHLHFFDKNWNYVIQRMGSKSVDVRVTLREETKDAFKSTHVGSRQTCLVRQGTYASMTIHSIGKPAQVSESRCMHVEGDECIYHISWN